MTDRYEMPHARADECPHAGVGKACRPCRERFERAPVHVCTVHCEQGQGHYEVRRHLPVRPDREAVARAILARYSSFDLLSAHGIADAVLDLWPGESRAQVEASALRAYADDLNLHRAVEDGWEKYGDDLCGDAPDPCLFWDMTHAEQERIRARADRIEKGETP